MFYKDKYFIILHKKYDIKKEQIIIKLIEVIFVINALFYTEDYLRQNVKGILQPMVKDILAAKPKDAVTNKIFN